MNTLALWQRLHNKPLGKWLFGRMFCFIAPYFGTIKPQFLQLEPKRCQVGLRKRRAVHNHIGTVHAIAMCNLAEAAAGAMTEVTVPPATHRWIPTGMTVEYLKKATTDLVATATPATGDGELAENYPVQVEVLDRTGTCVFRALITMRVSPREKS